MFVSSSSLSTKRTRATLLEGPPELTKPFIFEAAIHWAEASERVLYITPNRLECLPVIYHDRTDIVPESFKLVKFMYPENYQALVDKLVDLENCLPLPSVILMDDLDAYIRGTEEIRAVALLALIRDSTNACGRILNSSVRLCIAAESTSSFVNREYFEELWQLRQLTSDEPATLLLRLCRMRKNGDEDTQEEKAFFYQKLNDGGLVLKRLSEIFVGAPMAITSKR